MYCSLRVHAQGAKGRLHELAQSDQVMTGGGLDAVVAAHAAIAPIKMGTAQANARCFIARGSLPPAKTRRQSGGWG